MSRLASALLVSLFAIGCHAKQELTAPPPPLRPEPQPVAEKKDNRDCDKTDAAHELKSLEFGQRSITEGANFAAEGHKSLKSAENAESDKLTREGYITDAVRSFITALAADPYNVMATYDLAAAYARIGRNQCSLNMLERVIQMRNHPSKKVDVDLALDHLLGRKGTQIDGNFANLRLDERFRLMVSKICEDQNDANCVYGAGGKH